MSDLVELAAIFVGYGAGLFIVVYGACSLWNFAKTTLEIDN